MCIYRRPLLLWHIHEKKNTHKENHKENHTSFGINVGQHNPAIGIVSDFLGHHNKALLVTALYHTGNKEEQQQVNLVTI